MAYTYDNEGNLIDMEMKLPETKRKPVRKPNAVPPKTKTIIKAQSGGPVKPVVRKENLNEQLAILMINEKLFDRMLLNVFSN